MVTRYITSHIRAGYAESPTPLLISKNIYAETNNSQLHFGKDCIKLLKHNNNIKINKIIENNKITNNLIFEKYLKKIFYDINKIDICDNNSILISNYLNFSNSQKNILAELLFETFGFNKIIFQPQPILSIYSSGLQSGIIFDSGDVNTQIISIIDSYIIKDLLKVSTIAGSFITEALKNKLNNRGIFVNDYYYNYIKENYLFASQDINFENNILKKCSYFFEEVELPDGNKVKIENERFLVPEKLFHNPSYNKSKEGSLPELLSNVILESNINIKRDLCNKILVLGGNTMFPGFSERVNKDLCHILDTKMNNVKSKLEINFINNSQKLNSVYLGGHIFTELKLGDNIWITKEEYKEKGEKVISEKIINNIKH